MVAKVCQFLINFVLYFCIIGGKDTYRGSDYRLSALYMCWIMQNHDSCPREIKVMVFTSINNYLVW